jgi:hypothetical protein
MADSQNSVQWELDIKKWETIGTSYWESLPYCFISHALFISWHQRLTHPDQDEKQMHLNCHL